MLFLTLDMVILQPTRRQKADLRNPTESRTFVNLTIHDNLNEMLAMDPSKASGLDLLVLVYLEKEFLYWLDPLVTSLTFFEMNVYFLPFGNLQTR